MPISKISFSATIATQQYSNIQPTIEMTDVSIDEAENIGLGYIKDLYAKYSSLGPLKENKIRTSADKINDIL